MGSDASIWKKGLIALLAAALFTAGIGVIVYVLVARNRIMPTPTPTVRLVAKATLTGIPSFTPVAVSTVFASDTPEARDKVTGLVKDYSPGALIIVLDPTEGSATQIIVPENLTVAWGDGRRASPREIVPGQTLYAEGELDALNRLVAARIVITKQAEATATSVASATPLPVPTVTPLAGWKGEYYGNKELGGPPALVRQDLAIDFQWHEGAAAPGLPLDDFGVRWRGRWEFEEGGYRFYAFTDDGVRVWIDGDLIIDQWRNQAPTLSYADHYVKAGAHDLQVEYFDGILNAEARVWWDFQGAFPDWRGEYYPNRVLSGQPSASRNEPDVAFDWAYESPSKDIPADNFSARWTRKVAFAEGAYRFSARADDAIRVWVDDLLLIDEWHENDNRTYERYLWLDGGPHDLRVEYAEYAGLAQVRVWWREIDEFEHWRGAYYGNSDLQGRPLFVLDDQEINFNWGEGSRGFGLPNDNYSVRWTRTLAFEGGRYRFWAEADDGVRVIVDQTRVINEWHEASAGRYEGELVLTSGAHTVTVEYYERGDQASIRVGWETLLTPTPGVTPTATLPPASVTPTSAPASVTPSTAPATATSAVPSPTTGTTATAASPSATATQMASPTTATRTATLVPPTPSATAEPTATEAAPTPTASPEPSATATAVEPSPTQSDASVPTSTPGAVVI